MDEQTKKRLSIGMVALSGFVLVSVFGTPGGGGHPLIPSLVPLFGIGFGFIFAIFSAWILLFF